MRNGCLKKKLQRSKLGRYIDFSTKRPKPSERRILFTMLTMMICFGLSAYVMCTELISVPRKSQDPSWFAGKRDDMEQSDWSYTAGDHKVSALENIIMVLGGFFGFMRLIDLMLLFYREDPERFMKILNDKE